MLFFHSLLIIHTLYLEYKGKFDKGTLPIHESIGYADYLWRCFFEKAKKESWYNNTLFIITADHTGPSNKHMTILSAECSVYPLFFINREVT